jgi:geranylgeranyl diphosphate synthase type I
MTRTRAPADPPPFLAEIGGLVDARITALLDSEEARWSAVEADLLGPLAAIRRLVGAGGKRLRPAFCYWAFVGAGGSARDSVVVDAGAALELLHTSALLHDDVIDASPLRRGQGTAHVVFAQRHSGEGWSGDSRRFGEGAAVLAGDIASAYANGLLSGAPPAALDVFVKLALELDVGQYLDLVGTARRDATAESAATICRYKSGKYTVERPLHLGVALADAGALSRLSGPLSDFGVPLGDAFQLRDDLLGTFGDSAVTGKPVGEDLREGKPTLLYALARARAGGRALSLLGTRFGSPDLTGEDIRALQEVLEETGARRDVEREVDRLADEAIGALTVVRREGISDEACSALRELATYAAGRDR